MSAGGANDIFHDGERDMPIGFRKSREHAFSLSIKKYVKDKMLYSPHATVEDQNLKIWVYICYIIGKAERLEMHMKHRTTSKPKK